MAVRESRSIHTHSIPQCLAGREAEHQWTVAQDEIEEAESDANLFQMREQIAVDVDVDGKMIGVRIGVDIGSTTFDVFATIICICICIDICICTNVSMAIIKQRR